MFGDLPPAPSCNYFVDIDFVDEGSDTDSDFESAVVDSAVVDTDCIVAVAVAVAAAEAWMDMVAVAVVFVAVVDTVVEVQV